MGTNKKTINEVNLSKFLALPEGRGEVESLLNVFSDNGICGAMDAAEKLFVPDGCLEYRLENLAGHMAWFAAWIEEKRRAFDLLTGLGFEGVVSRSQIHEPLAVVYRDQTYSGEWCRTDGLIFVRYRGTVDATPAVKRGRERDRVRSDRWAAERMCQGLVDEFVTQHDASRAVMAPA